MALTINTNIINDSDGYSLNASQVKGGYIVVKDNTERDAIPDATKVIGTKIYNVSDKTEYRWDGSTWEKVEIIDAYSKKDIDDTLKEYAKSSSIPIIPENISSFTNDKEYVTATDLESKIPTKTSQLTNDSGYLIEHQSLENYALKDNIPKTTSNLTNDSGYITEAALDGYAKTEDINNKLNIKLDSTVAAQTYQVKGDYALVSAIPTALPASDVKEWAKADTKPSYTASEVGAYAKTEVYSKEEIDSKGFLVASDISGKLNATDAKTLYQPKGSYLTENSLTGYATQTWVEGKKYLTEHQSLEGYALKTDIPIIPESLPASDVKEWAKADTKPSYTASEVGAYAKTEVYSKEEIDDKNFLSATNVSKLDFYDGETSCGSLKADRLGIYSTRYFTIKDTSERLYIPDKAGTIATIDDVAPFKGNVTIISSTITNISANIDISIKSDKQIENFKFIYAEMYNTSDDCIISSYIPISNLLEINAFNEVKALRKNLTFIFGIGNDICSLTFSATVESTGKTSGAKFTIKEIPETSTISKITICGVN